MCECKHKHYEYIIAWANGKKIEYRNRISKTWVETQNPTWILDCEYRVKPEPKPDVVKYLVIRSNSASDTTYSQTGSSNAKCTFDGETDKLKSVEMI